MIYFYGNDPFMTGGITNQIGFLVDYLFAVKNLIPHTETNYLFLDRFFLNANPKDRVSFSEIIDIPWINRRFFPYIQILDIMDPRYPLVVRWEETGMFLEGQDAKTWLLDRFRAVPIKESSIRCVKIEAPGRIEETLVLYFDDTTRCLRDVEYRKAYGVGMGILQNEYCQTLWKNIPFCVAHPLPVLTDLTEKVNIIHMRNEPDIVFWNHGVDEGFIDHESENYKNVIALHLEKNESTIILTGRRENNPVIEWMKKEGYRVIIPVAYTPHLQLNAALDLLLAETYGNHILLTSRFSSYSTWLALRLHVTRVIEVS